MVVLYSLCTPYFVTDTCYENLAHKNNYFSAGVMCFSSLQFAFLWFDIPGFDDDIT